MNNKNSKSKVKVFNFWNNTNDKKYNNKSSKKNIIESYKEKINNKYYNFNKRINLEISSTTSEKNNNLSLFSYLSNNTYQEDKLTNKSLRTTKETEGNQINNKNKISSESKIRLKMNYKNQTKVKQKSKNVGGNANNNINITKELDKFKIRIDNLLTIIEIFENNYINSEKPKTIKEEFNKIIKDKKYFQMNNNNNIKVQNCTKSNTNIKKSEEKIQHHKIYNIYNSMNNINSKKQKQLLNGQKENKYNKRLKYCLLLDENSKKNVKVKTNRIIKEEKIKDFKNAKTQYFPSKSLEKKEKIYKEQKTKRKEKGKNLKIKNIYTKTNYNKTPIINKIKSKFNK